MTGQAGTVRAGTFHPNLGKRAEPGNEYRQRLIPGRCRRELGCAQALTGRGDHRGAVRVLMRVDTGDDDLLVHLVVSSDRAVHHGKVPAGRSDNTLTKPGLNGVTLLSGHDQPGRHHRPGRADKSFAGQNPQGFVSVGVESCTPGAL